MDSTNNLRIFDLDHRDPASDPFAKVETVRDYDRNIRSSMIIPIQHCMKLLEDHIKPGGRILEISSCTGLLSLRLASTHRNAQFYAVERNDACLEVIRENIIFANLVNYGGNFQAEWSKLTALPFEDNEFDVVFSFCAISRWRNPDRVIAECARVVKPGGLILLYDLARDASEGMISFILQYAANNADEFMRALKSSYSVPELLELLEGLGLKNWEVACEGVNLIASSKPLALNYAVGAPGIYEDIFGEEARR